MCMINQGFYFTFTRQQSGSPVASWTTRFLHSRKTGNGAGLACTDRSGNVRAFGNAGTSGNVGYSPDKITRTGTGLDDMKDAKRYLVAVNVQPDDWNVRNTYVCLILIG